MADQDLIDSIVPNETLGIKKKPSIFKIIAVVGILTIVVITSYSLFKKTKQEDAIPPLSLGESVAPIVTVDMAQKNAVTDAPINHDASVGAELIPNTPTPEQVAVGAVQPAPVTIANTSTVISSPLPLPASASVATPVQISPLTDAVVSKPLAQNLSPAAVDSAPASTVITSNEQVVEKAPIRKPKVAPTKKQVKKAVEAKETQQAYADEYTPKAPVIEEGVTHEEIIIFQ